ncbi:hypothetical protein SAMN04488074_10269 [Lentzea albidocapillata subsp. violacea]|uniref:Uncharacterized protein n=1 Tax=Lentzea albidocapillata subsp. violacea TaxID=128104 RepID=A0A1G8TRN5_9PSEU|nr:hypothetical protein [Lentzea albidocapillata]SDJ44191.1 hypothetical protein SAMN04488074_10269 [Lentzea albidocapillata subsp. violacea]
MRAVIVATTFLLCTACGVSTQDEPEPIGTSTTGEAPTPVVTQRPHSPPELTSATPGTPTTPLVSDR